MNTLEQRLRAIKIIPVITLHDAGKAARLAQVLVENGLPCAEITFRTPDAAQAIRNMREAFPDMLIGAGTVLTCGQVDEAINAGVDFIVSPGFNPTTVKYCQQRHIAIIPGVNSPSLVEQAMEMGLRTLKFFPAEPSGGVPMLNSLTAVYPVTFMPTGGVNPENLKHYLALGSVLACGGSWMVPGELIDNEQWDELAKRISDVAKLVA
ncbi:bifunctional 4-hydroxy-2-oxoglutarate aldolase/2-dehydro-3-deoxy-phosphogluconate aldolase [Enterobacteriaceae bacterium 4M9]|nr:bifunctional 4-hydroxy-2-oxoglutarate aldolase/2-dehydro-3-deoxy-phosphogluconate aldolase [Enterobacteriaceae bacterium 4M9]